MKKTKALILERSGNVYTVLAEDGSFRTARLASGKEVGEEIELREGGLVVPAWMSAVALLLIVLTIAFSWQSQARAATVALLSVDINPSVEIKLDANNLVQGASGVNADGKALLRGLPVKGKQSQEVLTALVERAIQLHYLSAEHPWVVLGASPEGTAPTPSLSGLVEAVSKVSEEKGFAVNVAAFQLTSEEKSVAKDKGLTPGEYGVWLSAKKAGVALSEGAVKDSAERARILAQEKVQAQVQAEKGTLKLGKGSLKFSPEDDRDGDQGKGGSQKPELKNNGKGKYPNFTGEGKGSMGGPTDPTQTGPSRNSMFRSNTNMEEQDDQTKGNHFGRQDNINRRQNLEGNNEGSENGSSDNNRFDRGDSPNRKE